MDLNDVAYQRNADAIEAIHQGIQQITEAEAFAQAHAVAKTFLTQLLDGSNGEASFDIKEYSDAVLYGLCVHWFDLPVDGQLAAGGWTPQALPARCPGHFTSPSRYIFSPNPGESAKDYGRRHGEALKHAVTAFVCKLRQEGRTPRAGSLTERIFDAFSESRSEARMAGVEHPIDELRASTLIGVMMGFLPTVDGNLRSVLYEWIEQRSLWTLQSTLLHHGLAASFNDAKAVIGPALRHSMTRSPVPDLVWRTVVADDRLGPVRVHSGQRVVVGILSATHQNLEACPAAQAHLPKNFDGDFPMFGGNRAAADAPTHACPGREMALGVLLGMLTALMEAGVLRTHPAPLTLILIKRPAN
jgi:cytochrome P450